MTNGHVDVVDAALGLFDGIVVAVLVNEGRTPLFAAAEGVAIISEAFRGRPNVEVDTFRRPADRTGRARARRSSSRGLRAVSDFEYEFQMALMNRKLRHTVETVFMMPHERYTYIASRLIKEVASLGAPVTGLVPPPVEDRLVRRRQYGMLHSPHSAPRHHESRGTMGHVAPSPTMKVARLKLTG